MATMRITLTKITPTKLRVLVERGEECLYTYDFTAMNVKNQAELASRLGLQLSDISGWIKIALNSEHHTAELTDNQNEVSILLRGQTQFKDSPEALKYTGEPLAVLKEVLNNVCLDWSNPVFSWRTSGQEQLCCVDIDYHTVHINNRPTFEELQYKASQVRPTPAIYHPSHGHGAKLYYVAHSGFAANELAAAGALSWIAKDGLATAELKSESRHPLYKRDFDSAINAKEICCRGTSDTDLQAVAYMFANEISDEDIENYLNENGLRRGEKYDHSHCPISPKVSTHGEPVFIGDYGISCHKCSASGFTYGSRSTAGFVPYSSLVNGNASIVSKLCRSFTHWTHAEFILSYFFRISPIILKLAYRCALKLVHGVNDIRIRQVFSPNLNIARINGEWIFVGDKNNTAVRSNAMGIFKELPACWDVTYNADVPKIKINSAKVETLAHAGVNLDNYGYTELRPIKGLPLWGYRLPYSDNSIPIPDKFVRVPNEYRPKFEPNVTPEKVTYAYTLLDNIFPGIDKDYVEFLVAARGLVEAGVQSVFAIVTGSTGTGKTSTPKIVAGILGDRATEVVWSPDEARLRQSIMSSIQNGSYSIVDELFKKSDTKGVNPRTAVDPILTLTPDSMSHKMYVGPTSLGGCTVYIITDIELPYEIAVDSQLGRRIVEVELTGRVPDWKVSTAKNNINKLEDFRRVSAEHNLAADILCTYWRDKFFSESVDINKLVGMTKYKWLENSCRYGSPDVLLRLFWEQVCKAPELTEKDAVRVESQPGWKIITTANTDDLRDTWDQLCDKQSGEGWRKSRRLKEPDWSEKLRKWYIDKLPYVVDLPKGVRIEFRYYKDTTIFVRFCLDREGQTVYNEDILKPR